jgi:hypothetical protein
VFRLHPYVKGVPVRWIFKRDQTDAEPISLLFKAAKGFFVIVILGYPLFPASSPRSREGHEDIQR